METHRVLYFTDGSDVIVSDSDFQVRNTSYPMKEIYSHRVAIVMPQRAPFTVLIVSGAFAFLCGAFDFLPITLSDSISFFGVTILVNAVVMVLGIAVMLLGMTAMFYLRDKYVVKVSTRRGEKAVLISHKREYVNQINDALNHAHLDLMKSFGRNENR